MKKIKMLGLALVMTSALAMLTACGKVPEPTEDDVVEALVDEDVLTKEQKKEKNYEVKIDKVDINDDQDRATVDCSLILSDGPISRTTEYEIKFSIRDDKESWKVRKGKVTAGDSKTELTKEISDDEIKKLFEYESFSTENDYIELNDENTTYEIGKHKLDKEAMTDTVTITGTADEGYVKINFTVEYVFMYSGQWFTSDEEVVEAEEEYSEGYDLSDTKAEDIIDMLATADEDFYIMGYSYKLYGDSVKIENAEFGDIEYRDTTAEVPLSFKLTQGNVSFKIDTVAHLKFDESSSEWTNEYVYDTVVSEVKADIVGTWNGSDDEGNTYVLKINDTFKKNSTDLSAEVSIKTAAGASYSYTAYVSDYDIDENTIDIYGDTWISKPSDTSVNMQSFDLKIEGTSLKSEWSWDSYTFTKAQ